MELLYAIAIRCSELARLGVGDLNRETSTLQIRRGNGKKDRVVPVGVCALRWSNDTLRKCGLLLEISVGV